jgi:predicted nuclease of predicted toxin-antitoxin system
MKLLLDMNLSPAWVAELAARGWEAVHWSTVGDPRATDREIMDWAKANGYVVFTHDLDFGALLAATRAAGPSVIQVRTQDVSPGYLAALLDSLLSKYRPELEGSALIVFDAASTRVRILPLMPRA